MEHLSPLIDQLKHLQTLNSISALLSWDQETYMPKNAIASRAEQIGLMSKLHHQAHTSSEFEACLAKYVDLGSGKIISAEDDLEKAMLKAVYKDWSHATRLHSEFVHKLSKLKSESQHAWAQARDEDNFSVFEPYLNDIIQLESEKAGLLDPGKPVYDVLLDEYEPEMTAGELKPVFDRLLRGSKALLKNIQSASPKALWNNATPLDRQKQWDFGIEVLTDMQYDFTRGRQDISVHPFTIDMGIDDVRITTRLDDTNFLEGFSSTVHEGGHALYEQGLNPEWRGTPLAQATSLGVHESQSRMWEKLVGKSLGFWQWRYPKLKSLFPEALNGVALDIFYRTINQVKPGLIRVEADELTYNIHILIRFEIEQAIFSGTVTVKDLPELWNQKYTDYLGITPESNKVGILQDVHWSAGLFGYFPTYTLGNLYAVQLFETAKAAIPGLAGELSPGVLKQLKDWLTENVFHVGRGKTGPELIESITGQPFSERPFLSYITQKYLDIYSAS